MDVKKERANWLVALIHYIIAGGLIPWVVSVIAMFVLAPIIIFNNSADQIEQTVNNSSFYLLLGVSTVVLLSIWLGVVISSRYIEKRYAIKENQKIVNLSVTYLIVVSVIFRIRELALSGITNESLVNILFFVAGVFVFYLASKKYLKNNIGVVNNNA